jgi:tetratricopeptide (TPR) repeat protein
VNARWRLLIILPLLLGGPVSLLPADQGSSPEAWVLLEKARALMDDRENPDMGEALNLLRQAIAQQALFPEAEFAIAEIYFREGALEPAKSQLRKVLQPEYLHQLRVGEDEWRALYLLADIQEIQGQYADMQDSLERILQAQPAYADKNQERFRDAFLKAYLERGLDRAPSGQQAGVLVLYRLENSGFTVAAHAKLGWFLYRTGRYDPASIRHLLFALDTIVTEAMIELRRLDPTYEFSSLADFLQVALRREEVRDYLVESGLFRVAYYLAASTWAAQHAARAAEIWQVLAAVDPQIAGTYAEMSRRQLASPFKEPLINPSARRVE